MRHHSAGIPPRDAVVGDERRCVGGTVSDKLRDVVVEPSNSDAVAFVGKRFVEGSRGGVHGPFCREVLGMGTWHSVLRCEM